MVSGRVVRIDRNRTLKFLLRLDKIRVGETKQPPKRGVRFGRTFVQLNRPMRGSYGFRKIFLRRSSGEQWYDSVGLRQSRISASVPGIDGDRLLKVIGGGLQIFTCSFVPKKSSFQIKFVRFGVLRRLLRHFRFLGPAELSLQCISNRFCDVAFYAENVREFSVVSFSPEM